MHDPIFEVGQVGGERIGDERALLSGDDDGALLERCEPVDRVAHDGSAAERAHSNHHVFVLASAAEGRAGVDRDVFLLADPSREVDVVGREVFDDVDIGDPTGEGALSPSGDLVDVTEYAVFQASAHRLQREVVAFDVAHATDEARFAEEGHQLAGRFGIRGDRLLDQRMDATLSKCAAHLEVVRGGGGDDAVVEPQVQEPFEVAYHGGALNLAGQAFGRVEDSSELDSLYGAQHSAMVAPHDPEAEYTRTQHAQLPALATSVTVCAMTSRSSWVRAGCTGSESTWLAARSVLGRSRFRPNEGSR